MDEHVIKKHSESLKKNGIVIIPNYWSETKCDKKRSEIVSAVDSGDLKVADVDMDYIDLMNSEEPIVSERKGNRDDGMLDIFNMDLAIPEIAEFKDDSSILEIINSATNEPYNADNLNVYLNKSVTNTRYYHADTYSGKFKSFLYLTDVPNESFGPFAYIKGSHNPSNLQKRIRRFVNSRFLDKPNSNALIHNKFKEVKCTAPKGTLIIANQAGLHRGTPQEKGKERILLTTSYTPVK